MPHAGWSSYLQKKCRYVQVLVLYAIGRKQSDWTELYYSQVEMLKYSKVREQEDQ